MSDSGLKSEPGLRELLKAGLHFGHQTRRWNPRMRRYIHGERDGIHIIDLLQTEQLLDQARDFAAEVAGKGGTVLFVGTKKQARDSVKNWAERCGMPYVNQRWLGGLLTNFQTMSARIDRLHELTGLKEDGRLDLLPTKERMSMEAELEKLEYNLGGVRDMKRLPAGGADHRPEDRGDRGRRGDAAAGSRSSAWSTRTSTRWASTTRSRATTTRCARASWWSATIGEAVENAANTYREAEAKRRAEEEAAPPRRGGGEAQARGGGARPQGGRGGRRRPPRQQAAAAAAAATPQPADPAGRRRRRRSPAAQQQQAAAPGRPSRAETTEEGS